MNDIEKEVLYLSAQGNTMQEIAENHLLKSLDTIKGYKRQIFDKLGVNNMEIRYFADRKDWRKWLSENFETADGIWFVFPNKSSGEQLITYNDAVEEALCFGQGL